MFGVLLAVLVLALYQRLKDQTTALMQLATLFGVLWVLLLSIAALQRNKLPKALNYLGFIVGSAGILTLYPADIFTEIFGLSQIVWFFWLGIVLLRKS